MPFDPTPKEDPRPEPTVKCILQWTEGETPDPGDLAEADSIPVEEMWASIYRVMSATQASTREERPVPQYTKAQRAFMLRNSLRTIDEMYKFLRYEDGYAVFWTNGFGPGSKLCMTREDLEKQVKNYKEDNCFVVALLRWPNPD